MLESVNYPEDLKKIKPADLSLLAGEIREFLIETVTKTGGHLSPNLGVVELTIALHYVFNAPIDDIIWDVGHQSYVHKILTGRKSCFGTLRMKNGLKGYPCPGESPFDPVHTGHSSTSLSIAAGIARAKIMSGDKSNTIAVIGDGSFTGGMAYEAINTISHDNLPVIIILNNNGMSISHNVGGITKYFKKLQISRPYLKFKRNLESIMLKRVPLIGRPLVGMLYKIKERIKSIVVRKNFFEDMGISYCGPIDGHNIKKLIETFEEIKNINKSIIIHVVTTKGKGYKPSEDNPGHYHGITGIAINGDTSIPIEKEEDSYSKVFGKTLVRLAHDDPEIFAITAAMKTGTGLKEFADLYPGRFTDVGIAEQHAVDYAVGLSLKGKKPVVAIYSTFLQRGFDQLVHDAGISKARVLFCLDRAGLVPGDGETHQGIFDISYLRMIPDFTIM
ncbi:MAG: 1-deoxy-D-xylulose-5-phosphate synthase, partial [Brevinematales bacterium]